MYMKKKKNKVRLNLTLFFNISCNFYIFIIYNIACDSTFPMESLMITEAFES